MIGNVIEVKEYTETYVPISFESDSGRPEYELHFYPGLRKIFLFHVTIDTQLNFKNVQAKIYSYSINLG